MNDDVFIGDPDKHRNRLTRCSEWLGMASLWLFVASIALSTAGMYLGLTGMLASILGTARPFWSWAKSRAVFWPALALTAWILIGFAGGSPYDVPPATASDATRDLLRLAGIPALIVGWWLVRLREQWQLLFLVAALGLLATVLLQFDWSDPASYFDRRRPSFGLGGNGLSVYGVVLVIGCLTVGRSMLVRIEAHDPVTVQRVLVWGVLVALGIFLFFVGQSRSVWLATVLVAGLLAALTVYRHGLSTVAAGLRARPRRVVAIVLGCALLLIPFGPVIIERVIHESATWNALFALQLDHIPSTSIGYRIAMWWIALEQIVAHPVAGVGAGAAETIMAASDNPILDGRTFPHFHNAYLEVAVSLGLPGFVLFVALFLALALPAVRALRAPNRQQRMFGHFVVLTGLMIGVTSLFQIRFDDPPGMALCVFLSGCALACGNERTVMGSVTSAGNRGDSRQ